MTERPFFFIFSFDDCSFQTQTGGVGKLRKLFAMESEVSPEILAERLSEAVSALQQATSDNMVRPPDCYNIG